MKSRAPLLRTRRKVALLIETSNAYGRGLLEGITDYVHEHDFWSIYLPEQGRGTLAPDTLRKWNGDGIIARVENRTVGSALASTRLPIVDVSAARVLPNLPWVETDDVAIAALAFQHLAERGFQHYAFCGDSTFNWSNGRRDHFRKLVAKAGQVCHEFDLHAHARLSWEAQQRDLAAWLDRLPRPSGVLACYDVMAQRVLDACRDSDIAVPEEMAVIGVDNDELLCRMSDPPLSTVIPDPRRAGYEAAGLLSQLMAGEKIKPLATLIPPRGVATRQSTDVLAINDRHVAEALRFIREHVMDGIRVADVLARSRLSRRALEGRFQRIMGRTPHDELLRARMSRIKALLSETDIPVARIAEQAGYEHLEYMSAQFHRVVGVSPRTYRMRHRRK